MHLPRFCTAAPARPQIRIGASCLLHSGPLLVILYSRGQQPKAHVPRLARRCVVTGTLYGEIKTETEELTGG